LLVILSATDRLPGTTVASEKEECIVDVVAVLVVVVRLLQLAILHGRPASAGVKVGMHLCRVAGNTV